MTRFHVENFGCRASQADGDAIAAALLRGSALPADLQHADVVVVNTCTVTAEADRDARAYIRRARRTNPNVRVVVTGCYAQRSPQEVAALPGVSAVIGNSHKNHVASIALGLPPGSVFVSTPGRDAPGPAAPIDPPGSFVPLASLQSQPEPVRPFLLAGDIFAHSDFQLPSLLGHSAHRTRPSLKIQDGCGNRCTFCIIPSVRGNSRSLPRAQVIEAVHRFAESGGKELVLSGINLGRWGRDLAPQMRLEDLLAEIFETTALPRLRISSVEPMDWTAGLIALFSRYASGDHPRLARHAHMPLQSGSDSVLRRMHRRYRPWHYAERVAAVRAAAGDAAIGADVMIGFPGETDEEFEQTRALIEELPFTYLHLFPFSARPGTPAWELDRQSPVPAAAVRDRMACLRSLIDQKNLAFRSTFVGRTLSAVTLACPPAPAGEAATPITTALTENFLPVELDRFHPPNSLLLVAITHTTAAGLCGIVL